MQLEFGSERHIQYWSGRVSRRFSITPYSCPISVEDLAQEASLGVLSGRKSVSGPMEDLIDKEFTKAGTANRRSRKRISVRCGDMRKFERAPAVSCPERALYGFPPVQILQKRLRQVIDLYYWQGKTLRQIGEVIGLKESRVCQLHREALDQLKKAMAHA